MLSFFSSKLSIVQNGFRLALGVGVAALLAVFVGKPLADIGRPQQRGVLVARIVREHRQQVTSRDSVSAPRLNRKNADQNFASLKEWFVLKALKDLNPAKLRTELAQVRASRQFPETMNKTFDRWHEGLGRWSREKEGRVTNVTASNVTDDFLRKGRQRYFEALGYQKIGRPYDGTVSYIWAIDLLSDFIQMDSEDDRLPEALYLLGAAYLNLRHSMPDGLRSDRMLHLCSEFYPDSVWASQASLHWRNERNHGI